MAESSRKKRKVDADRSATNGETQNQPKDEQRAAKRLKKAKEVVTNDTSGNGKRDERKLHAKKDEKTARAMRKAEKAKRKVERAVAAETEMNADEERTPINSTLPQMETGSGGEIKPNTAQEARERAQAQKEARTRMIINGIGKVSGGESPGSNPKMNGNETSAADESNNGWVSEVTELRTEKIVDDESKNAAQDFEESSMPVVDSSNKKKKSYKDKAPESEAGFNPEEALASLPQRSIDDFLQLNHIKMDDPMSQHGSSLRPILDFKYLPQAVKDSQAKSLFSSYKAPTPVQAAAWPHLLAQRDVIGIAETGSGKTLAFGIPCVRAVRNLQSSKKPSRVRAVIVSPTRELASQIHAQLDILAKACSLKTVCIYGGVPKDPQREDLKSAHIIVATPGRLNDLVEEGSANLKHAKYVVLDEADRMLDTGFEDAIKEIISGCPPSAKGRQTSMFTATWPQSVRELAATFMVQPVHIAIGADNPNNELRANRNVKQIVEVLDSLSKEGRLRELVRQYSPSNSSNRAGMSDNRILIFCLYKKECARIENMLRKSLSGAVKGIACIHGDMSQPLRTASLKEFKIGNLPILVATDVAARGLDIPDVKVVINFTFPLTAEDYVHRIGRTGRAGKQGLSVTLFTHNDKAMAGELVNVLRAGDQEIPEDLLKFDLTVKRKEHGVYGKFYREPRDGEKAKGTITML